MPSYLHPGVYVEEIPSGSRPIEGVATSVAAFVGAANRGRVGEPVLVGSFTDYVAEFGEIKDESDAMGLALQAFYLNGGGAAYVCRLAGSQATAQNADPVVGEKTSNQVLKVAASSPGEWGNELRFKIKKEKADATEFEFSVGLLEDGKYQELELFTGLTMNAGRDSYAVTVVNGESKYIELEDVVAASDYSEASVEGTAVTIGDVKTYLSDSANSRSFMLSLNGSDFRNVTLPENSVIDANGDGSTISEDEIAAAIKGQVALTFAIDPGEFAVTHAGGKYKLATTLGAQRDSETEIQFHDSALLQVLGITNETATLVRGVTQVVPKQMLGTSPVADRGVKLAGGQDTAPTHTQYQNFYAGKLRKYRDVSILVLPGASWDGGPGQSIVAATLSHCEKMQNRVVIVDPPESKELSDASKVSALGLPTSTYSVLYYPWVAMANPLYHPDKTPSKAKTVYVAPSAVAAGMWAKIDAKRGVWKAPAGVEARLTGAVKLAYQVENLEQDQLNPLGINCIRKLPNYGSVFWGARTLATKADPEWRYVPVRRTAIFIEESIYNGIQWAVFEPNDHPLWSSLRANIGGFMDGLFRAGAFQGRTAKEAYFVRCGLGDTMTQADIDRGQVIVMVGFAPLKPAEFVIVRIQQKVGEET